MMSDDARSLLFAGWNRAILLAECLYEVSPRLGLGHGRSSYAGAGRNLTGLSARVVTIGVHPGGPFDGSLPGASQRSIHRDR